MQCWLKALHKGVLHGKQPPAFRTLYLTTVPAIMSPKFFFFSYVLHSSYIVSPTVKTTEDTDQFGRQQVVYEKTWKEIWLHLYNPEKQHQWMLKRHSAHRKAEFNKTEESDSSFWCNSMLQRGYYALLTSSTFIPIRGWQKMFLQFDFWSKTAHLQY